MCRLCEEMSRKVGSIDLTVLIPRKLYRKLSPILLIFAQGNFSFGVVTVIVVMPVIYLQGRCRPIPFA